jgi:putative two-component system response regulator
MPPARSRKKETERDGSFDPRKIEKAYRKLKRSYRDLKDSHVEMAFKLALMSEIRDRSTGAHLVRIADYSALIAEGMGLSPEDIETIRFASPMHDVGKVMISDGVLKKKGKLTHDERKQIEKHPEFGAKVFKGSKNPMMKACEIIAISHHERYDGTGYPAGLKGAEIPLFGRIVALADCFDAYTSRRSYKEAYGFEEAVEMVRQRKGTHFDPDVVEAFLQSLDKAEKIWEANKDIQAFLDESDVEQEKLLD